MEKNYSIKHQILEKVANGREVAYKGKSNYSVGGKIVHCRFCSFDCSDNNRFKFNINPNTLRADYELWICGDCLTFYLMPIIVLEEIYNDKDTYIDGHHPEIRVVSVDRRTDRVIYGVGGKSLNASCYRNVKTI